MFIRKSTYCVCKGYVKVLGKLLKYQLINSKMAQNALKTMIPLPQLPKCLAG